MPTVRISPLFPTTCPQASALPGPGVAGHMKYLLLPREYLNLLALALLKEDSGLTIKGEAYKGHSDMSKIPCL